MDNFRRIGISTVIMAATLALLAKVARADTLSATARIPIATPQATMTPMFTTSTVCALAFDDYNGNSLRDPGEGLLSGVTFTLSDATGLTVPYVTDGRNEPYCFDDLQPATYQLTMRPPPGYVATTNKSLILAIQAGYRIDIENGVRLNRSVPTSREGDIVARRAALVVGAILVCFVCARLLTRRR
jgi:hypothetical protein